MNCVVCKGKTKPGKTTITFEKDGATLVFKSVPAHMCNVCGEAYVNEDITDDF